MTYREENRSHKSCFSLQKWQKIIEVYLCIFEKTVFNPKFGLTEATADAGLYLVVKGGGGGGGGGREGGGGGKG